MPKDDGYTPSARLDIGSTDANPEPITMSEEILDEKKMPDLGEMPGVSRAELRKWSRRGLRSVNTFAIAGDPSQPRLSSEVWDMQDSPPPLQRIVRAIETATGPKTETTEFRAEEFKEALHLVPARPRRGVASACLLHLLSES